MIRWRKVRTVATFEFLAAVKRAGYLIATFGMPLFMAAYGGIVAVPAYFAQQKDREPVVYGIVDAAGVLRLTGDRAATGGQPIPEEMRRTLEATGQAQVLDRALTSDNFLFRPFAHEPDARAALTDRTLKGYFVIPESYLGTGHIDAYLPDRFTFSTSDARDAIADLVREHLVAGRLDAATSARILDPIQRTRRYTVTRTGEIRDGGMLSSVVRLAVPIIFMVLFLVSVLMTSGYLIQGTATEKENKVVEVLLSSANPDEILAGKLLGLGGAGLLQITVWLTMLMATGFGVIPMLVATRVDAPWLALALAVPFFIVAFLFFGSLMLGTGSLGSNMRESQQLSMVWSLTAAAPMMMMMVLLHDPNGPVARVMSWIPFTAAQLMMLRATTDAASLAWWEIAGSFAVLVFSTWVALRVGARLFRIGLLSAGSRPSLREIVRRRGWQGDGRGRPEGLRYTPSDVPRPCRDCARSTASRSLRTFSNVSASCGGLSRRQRSMRGKRTATPERCRDERAMPSKPSSKTCVGSTCRTGPKRSTVWRRIQRSISAISSLDRPEYALATGTSSPWSQTPNV